MKKFFIAIILFTGIAFQSNGQDYAVIAKEYCDCFKKMKDTMDTEFRELLIRVAKQPDIKAAFAKEMNGLEATKRRRIGEQLEMMGTSIESEETEAGKCGKKLDIKYEKHTDTPEKEKAFDLKLISELKKNKDCEFLWAVSVFALAFSDED
jgi:hypothetical protein